MPKRRYAYRVTLAQVGPARDPLFVAGGPALRDEVLRWVLVYGLEEKDRDLAAGLDRFGERLAAISERTRENRHSAMGPADPDAPPLTPAHGLSRTRSLLGGEIMPRAAGGCVEFYWGYDEHTGASWGKILSYHAAGEGRLPVRDVIGLSPAALARVRDRVAAQWELFKLGVRRTPTREVPVPPNPAPPFVVRRAPRYQPKFPGLAAPKNPRHVSRLEINGKVITLGASAGGKVSAAAVRRDIAAGTFRDFDRSTGAERAARRAAFRAKYGGGGAPPPAPNPAPPASPPAPRPAAVPPPKPAPRPAAIPAPKQAPATVPRPKPKPGPKPSAAPKPAAAPTPPPPKPRPAGPSVPYTRADLPELVEHRRYIRAEHDAALARIAGELGTTPEALRGEIAAKIKAAVGHGEFYLRVDSGTLPKVLESGRFKTQFEVKTSLGSYDPESRSKAEAALFGTPTDIDPAKRPVYGYMGRPDFASARTNPERSVETYGDVVVRLKPSVRSRATVTASDSLSFHDMLQGVPASAPTADAFPIPGGRFGPVYERFLRNETDPAKLLDALNGRFGYLEAQYHGGLGLDDIAELAFLGPPSSRVREALEARGIPWRVVRDRSNDEDD